MPLEPTQPIVGGRPVWEGQDVVTATINELLNRAAHGPHLIIKDRDLTAPPGSPSEGDAYLVKATATGAWAGQDGMVATYYGGWQFRALQDGETLTILDEGVTPKFKSYWYNNAGTLNKIYDAV